MNHFKQFYFFLNGGSQEKSYFNRRTGNMFMTSQFYLNINKNKIELILINCILSTDMTLLQSILRFLMTLL